MATARNICKAALRKVGAVSRGFTPSDEDLADALEELNAMLAGWAHKSLLVPYRTEEALTLVSGQGEYTWGTGGDFVTETPLQVLSAYLDDGTTSYPLRQFSYEEWQRVPVKSTSGIPEWFNYDYGEPLGNLRFEHVVDSAYTFNVVSLKPITGFSTISSTDNFPDHYEDTIRWNLAERMAPEELGEDALRQIRQMAKDLRDDLKHYNASFRVPTLQVDPALQPHRQFNINEIN